MMIADVDNFTDRLGRTAGQSRRGRSAPRRTPRAAGGGEEKKTARANRLDRLIGYLSPAAGVRRQAARQLLAAASSYRGAKKDRPRSNWLPGGGSADEDLLEELDTLRERSRDLIRNDALAAGAIDTLVDNVVGTGFSPQSRVPGRQLGWSPQQTLDFQTTAEALWHRWADSTAADVTGALNFCDVSRLIFRQILENGDVIALRQAITDEPGRAFDLAWDVIEADRLDTPARLRSDAAVRSGVQRDSRGRPRRYYLLKGHPGDVTLGRFKRSRRWMSVPRFDSQGRPNLLHLYRHLRPQQSRGVPFLTPSLPTFKDLGEYLEAEVVAARVAACFSVFIKGNNPLDRAVAARTSTSSDGKRIQELEPALIHYLSNDEDIAVADPKRPNSNAGGFIEILQRSIGTSIGFPLELLTKNFSKTNYSSARAALLEARRLFKYYQRFMVWYFCQVSWELLMEEAWLRGELPVDDFPEKRALYTRTRWITPGWGWVDPTKEVAAKVLAVDNNITTLADECAENGKDWEETLELRAREQQRARDLNLTFVGAGAATAPDTTGAANE